MQKEWTPLEGFFPCLSEQQPHTWLISHQADYPRGKDIENRDWTTSYRGPRLVHAGKRADEHSFGTDGRLFVGYWRHHYGDELVACMPQRQQEYELGGIVGIATLVDVVTRSASPWFCGRYGWVLRDARPLPFIPYRGQLGLFRVPVSILPPSGLTSQENASGMSLPEGDDPECQQHAVERIEQWEARRGRSKA